MAGAPTELTICGKVYKASPLTLEAHAEIEAHIVSTRPDPIELAAKSLDRPGMNRLSSESRRLLMEAAVRQAARDARGASPQEIGEFLGSIDGVAFLLWLMMREHHKEIDSPVASKKLIYDFGTENLQTLMSKIDRASGMADLGNSPGQAGNAKATSPSPGPKSTAT